MVAAASPQVLRAWEGSQLQQPPFLAATVGAAAVVAQRLQWQPGAAVWPGERLLAEQEEKEEVMEELLLLLMLLQWSSEVRLRCPAQQGRGGAAPSNGGQKLWRKCKVLRAWIRSLRSC